MTGPPPAQTPRNVPALLIGLREQRFTGAVLVSARPGGTIHLREGLVTAVVTPGAPSPESVLLRSGRISEPNWTTARTASRADGHLAAALVAHRFIGAPELHALCTAAVFDGAFAMALSPLDSWQVVSSAAEPELAVHPGIEPQQLTDETARRMAVLARLWGPPGELAGTRIRPAANLDSGTLTLAPRYRDILLSANGRRIPRDIAFALGRGVFPVMLDLTRMAARRLVQRESTSLARSVPSVAPREAATAAPVPDGAAPLPRRSPGDHLDITRTKESAP